MANSNIKKSSPILSTAGSDFQLFTPDSIPDTRRCICLISGDGGSGKTSYVTRFAPDPISFFDFDNRSDIPIEYAVTELNKTIVRLKMSRPSNILRMSIEEAKKAGRSLVDQVVKNLEWTCEKCIKGEIVSGCLDTVTELAEIISIAIRGRLDRPEKGDYGKSKDLINREFWNIFSMVRQAGLNFIVLSRATEIWIDNQPTGNFRPKCPSVVFDAVDWGGHIRLRTSQKGKIKKDVELEIIKASNREELGSIYTEKDWGKYGPFAWANSLQYGTMPGAWISQKDKERMAREEEDEESENTAEEENEMNTDDENEE